MLVGILVGTNTGYCGTRMASPFTALLNGTAGYRSFHVAKCGYNVTIPEIYHVFAAHQVEWNLMGKTKAWWSVLTNLPKTAEVSDDIKQKFYASGWRGVKACARFWLRVGPDGFQLCE